MTQLEQYFQAFKVDAARHLTDQLPPQRTSWSSYSIYSSDERIRRDRKLALSIAEAVLILLKEPKA
jgi:hypothetical protein